MTAPYADPKRYDFTRILDLKAVQVVEGSHEGLWDDNTLVLKWRIPNGSDELAKEWIYANRQVLTSAELPFRQLSGPYRTVKVTCKTVGVGTQNEGVELEQVISKGLYTSIDWDSARIVSDERSLSNNKSAGVTSSASDSPQKFTIVRFPYCNPASVHGMVLSLTENTYTKSVRGQSLGELHNVVATAKLDEDGSYSIYLTLAAPQYTLQSFSDLAGTNQNDIYYLWDVPKNLAQDILDAWKTAHPIASSATADYNDSQKLVNIILRKNTMIKPNLSLTGIKISCDTTQSMHFAWGYPKADIQAFIMSHNSPTGNGSRQVQVGNRGDGLYDITIVETTIVAPAPPHCTVDLPIGDTDIATREYGWNLSKDQLDTVKARLEALRIIGKTVTIDVNKNKEVCTFDYTATVVTAGAQYVDMDLSGSFGINIRSRSLIGGKLNDIAAFVSRFVPNKRKRHSTQISKQQDGTVIATVEEQTVRETPKTTIGSGLRKLMFGDNTDIPILSPNEKLQGGSVSPKDDGTVGFNLSIKDTNAKILVDHTFAGKGVDRKETVQIGGDLSDKPIGTSSSDELKVFTGQLQPDEDNTLAYRTEETTFKGVGSSSLNSGTKLFGESVKILDNKRPSEIESLMPPVSTAGVRREARLEVDPLTGKFRASIVDVTSNESNEFTDVQDDGQFKTTTLRKRNASTPYTLNAGEIGTTESRINDDEKLDIIKQTLLLSPKLATLTTQRKYQAKIVKYIYPQVTIPHTTGKRRIIKVSETETKIVKETNSFHSYKETLIKRKQTVNITETVTYSLSTLQALTGSVTGGEGEYDSVVDIPRAGLFRRVTTVRTATPETSTYQNSWRLYASGHTIIESESSSSVS